MAHEEEMYRTISPTDLLRKAYCAGTSSSNIKTTQQLHEAAVVAEKQQSNSSNSSNSAGAVTAGE